MRDIFTNEYNNHRDEHGESWSNKWFHDFNINTTSIPSRKGFGQRKYFSEEDKKNFALHRKYTMWLVGRPYKQPSFEEWKKSQLN